MAGVAQVKSFDALDRDRAEGLIMRPLGTAFPSRVRAAVDQHSTSSHRHASRKDVEARTPEEATASNEPCTRLYKRGYQYLQRLSHSQISTP